METEGWIALFAVGCLAALLFSAPWLVGWRRRRWHRHLSPETHVQNQRAYFAPCPLCSRDPANHRFTYVGRESVDAASSREPRAVEEALISGNYRGMLVDHQGPLGDGFREVWFWHCPVTKQSAIRTRKVLVDLARIDIHESWDQPIPLSP